MLSLRELLTVLFSRQVFFHRFCCLLFCLSSSVAYLPVTGREATAFMKYHKGNPLAEFRKEESVYGIS